MVTPGSETTRLFAEEVRAGRNRGDVAAEVDASRAVGGRIRVEVRLFHTLNVRSS